MGAALSLRKRATDTNDDGAPLISENQLILLLARGKLSSRVQEQARALMAKPLDKQRAWSEEQEAAPLNWDSILERVVAEEVYPIFYRNLQAIGRESVYSVGTLVALTQNAINAKNAEREERKLPAPGSMLQAPCYAWAGSEGEGPAVGPPSSVAGPQSVREQLERLSKINAFRNALLTEELVRVLKLLADAGIPTIPLKGVALAQSLYGDPSLRTCVDIDILVPRSMVTRAYNLLRAEGYGSEFGLGFFANLLLRHDIEYALRRKERGFQHMVELHWGVLWGGRLEKSVADRLWADACPTTVFGAPAYALSPEWQILFLAAHAARHQWQGLKWLVDLHELFSSSDIDWDRLNKKAKQLGWEELLRISLHACHALFDTPIPASFFLGELPSWVKLFPASAPANVSDAFFATRLLKRPSEKLRYVTRVFLVPTLAEWRLISLPSFLGFLYYPLRPLRLGCKWSWGLLAGSLGGLGVRGER